MVHFLTGDGPFAKLAQLKLKDKCRCGKEQTTEHLRELWSKCERMEQRAAIKILQDRHKQKEFQLLLKKMEKRLEDEERQSKSRRPKGQKTKANSRFFSWLNSTLLKSGRVELSDDTLGWQTNADVPSAYTEHLRMLKGCKCKMSNLPGKLAEEVFPAARQDRLHNKPSRTTRTRIM